MYYICIENNLPTTVLNYMPNLPSSMRVVEITDEENEQLIARTHIFDTTTDSVISNPDYVDTQEQDSQNAINREFLNSTDWMVLRHIRQKALNQSTTLTEQEYLDLEQQRADAAALIV